MERAPLFRLRLARHLHSAVLHPRRHGDAPSSSDTEYKRCLKIGVMEKYEAVKERQREERASRRLRENGNPYRLIIIIIIIIITVTTGLVYITESTSAVLHSAQVSVLYTAAPSEPS
ncbi:hypothetical protein AOLI_G00168890 [Acnodon oligacanthus]